MTDGCGFASSSIQTTLYHKFHWESFPTAVQMRVNGAKVYCYSADLIYHTYLIALY